MKAHCADTAMPDRAVTSCGPDLPMNYASYALMRSGEAEARDDRWRAAVDFTAWLMAANDGARKLDPGRAASYLIAARQHRVVGRLVERLLASGQAEELAELYGELARVQCRDIHAQRCIESTALELCGRLAPAVDEFIVVKGLAAFHATRNPFLVRNSSDGDILVRDPFAAFSAIRADGILEFKPPVQHEEVNAIFRGIHFDFHKFFPVWVRSGKSVPSDIAHAASRRIEHSGNISIRAIAYDDVRDNSVVERSAAGVEIRYPSSAVAAFLQITHFYRDLIRVFIPSTRRRPRVRLQELLDVRDFVRSTSFDATHFVRLVDRYQAREQAVVCARCIWLACGDDSLLRALGELPQGTGLLEPIRLDLDVWYGFTFCFTTSLAELLYAPMLETTAISRIPATAVAWGEEMACALSLGDGRSVVHTHGEVQVCRVDLVIDGDMVMVRTEFEAADDSDAPHTLFLSLGYQYFQVNFGTDDPRFRRSASIDSKIISESHEQHGRRHRSQLRVGFDRIQQSLGELRAVVAVGALATNGHLDHGALLAIRAPLPETDKKGHLP